MAQNENSETYKEIAKEAYLLIYTLICQVKPAGFSTSVNQ